MKGGIPRAFASHRGAAGAAYGRYARAVLARLGELPPSTLPTLKMAGRLVVEIAQDEADRDRARARRRLTEMRRIDRRLIAKRALLLKCEERIESVAAQRPRVDGPVSVADFARAQGASR